MRCQIVKTESLLSFLLHPVVWGRKRLRGGHKHWRRRRSSNVATLVFAVD